MNDLIILSGLFASTSILLRAFDQTPHERRTTSERQFRLAVVALSAYVALTVLRWFS